MNVHVSEKWFLGKKFNSSDNKMFYGRLVSLIFHRSISSGLGKHASVYILYINLFPRLSLTRGQGSGQKQTCTVFLKFHFRARYVYYANQASR